ncbi:MAG: superoxide dismutase [Candidatus Eremiobacteraeota bacterium]|nr:superoxide dismutase [Candidatus Eremiobacteraeota bacterium]
METYTPTKTYTAKKWELSGLHGISDATLEMHFGLYEGYVKNVNLLNERLGVIRTEGRAAGADPAYAELVRRLGFEYNGMRLHEYYFDNMTQHPTEVGNGKLYNLLGEGYGGFEQWKKDFVAVAGMRGIGWAIAYYDLASGQVSNYWINDHENGNVAGFVPIVVLDVWEHAYIKDYKPSDRGKYIEAFFANLDWKRCESRLPSGGNGMKPSSG